MVHGDDLHGMDSHLEGQSMHEEHVVPMEGVTSALLFRPPTHHLLETGIVINEPLLPIDFWHPRTQLLINNMVVCHDMLILAL